MRILPVIITVMILFSLLASPIEAQIPFEKGISLVEVTRGLKGPSSIDMDSAGRVYVASIYDMNGSGQPTDIYRVLPDGTVELFTAPLVDPDVLCLDSADQIYVGSWPGKITRIDPVTGDQTIWLNDTSLGNIDGMAFDGAGNMLVSAIDHSKINKVDMTTRAISVFADLTSLGLQGFGSIVVDPVDGSVFVASPKDGDLVHLDPDGSMANAALATGFQHMGQLALEGSQVFVSDNIAGTLYKVDRVSGAVSVFVNRIVFYAGSLLSLGNGEFLATCQSEDLTDGCLYRICPMKTSLGAVPSVGSTLVLDMESPADAGRIAILFITFQPGSVPISDGRSVPIDLSNFLLYQSLFDTAGDWSFTLSIPNKPKFIGKTIYTCYISGESEIMGISHSLPFIIQP